MDGQKPAHWQTLDFLCVNVCHLMPFVTISGVKESRLPVSQIIYSMMKWSFKIVPLCNCQLFSFFSAGLAKFFLVLRHAPTQFCILFHAIGGDISRGKWVFACCFFVTKETLIGFCNYIFIFSFCWFIFDTQVHWPWECSRPDCSTLTNFILFLHEKSATFSFYCTRLLIILFFNDQYFLRGGYRVQTRKFFFFFWSMSKVMLGLAWMVSVSTMDCWWVCCLL